MGSLSKDEQAQLEALKAKLEAPDTDTDDDGDDDGDDGVMVIRGKRADELIGRLFGPKRHPKKKATADDDGDDGTGDDGTGDDDDAQDDAPKPTHRFFR